MDENEVQYSEQDTAQNTDNQQDESQAGKDWQAEAAKWRAIAERNREKAEKSQTTEEHKLQPTNNSFDASRLERLELRTEGYTSEQVEEIMSLGGVKALENEKVQRYVKSLGNTPEDRAEHASDMPTGASSNYSTPTPKATELRRRSLKELEEMKAKFLK